MRIPSVPRTTIVFYAALALSSTQVAGQQLPPFQDFGKRFRHHAGNPLLTLESTNPWELPKPPEEMATALPGTIHPDVLYFPQGIDGYKFWMIFTPYEGFLGGGALQCGPLTPEECVPNRWKTLIRYWERLTLLRSNDGISWQKDGIAVNPVITPPKNCLSLEWDNGTHYDPDFVYAPGAGPQDQSWFLYFALQHECGGQHGIGLALSSDGIHYQKYGLVIPHTLATPTVVYDQQEGLFRMWYLYWRPGPPRGPYTIGYATSPDGINWTPWNPPLGCSGDACWHNAVLSPGGCDQGGISHPDVIKVENEFWMYYHAQPDPDPGRYHDLMIRRATSTDGIHWTKDGGAILSTDAILSRWGSDCPTVNPVPGDWVFWDRTGPATEASEVTLLYRPSVAVVGDAMYMWFGGLNKTDYGDFDSDRDIGLAFSTRFSDVLPTHWAYSAVEAVAKAGITTGCGNANFCPEATASRREVASFIATALEVQGDPSAGTHFCDVPQDSFTRAINGLYEEGIADACGDCAPPDTRKRFCPFDPMDRLQMGLFFYRALDLDPSAANYFTDVPPPWKPLIESLHEAIGTACGDHLYCPSDPATRAMLAGMTAAAFHLP